MWTIEGDRGLVLLTSGGLVVDVNIDFEGWRCNRGWIAIARLVASWLRYCTDGGRGLSQGRRKALKQHQIARKCAPGRIPLAILGIGQIYQLTLHTGTTIPIARPILTTPRPSHPPRTPKQLSRLPSPLYLLSL